MSKEIIEQKGLPNISVHKLEYLTVLIQDGKAPVDIHKSKATTVAKAIDPEYQKAEDERGALLVALQSQNERVKDLEQRNAKLVEALGGLTESVDTFCKTIPAFYSEESVNLWQKRSEAIQALQNTKNTEGL